MRPRANARSNLYTHINHNGYSNRYVQSNGDGYNYPKSYHDANPHAAANQYSDTDACPASDGYPVQCIGERVKEAIPRF